MNREAAQKIADAVLYEGYMLYPYRPSAIKNRQRWTFGTLYPPAYEEVGRGTESNRMRSESLLTGNERTRVHVQLRFLHLLAREVNDSSGKPVASVVIDGRTLESWDEGVPRSFECDVTDVAGPPVRVQFSFPEEVKLESIRDQHGELAGSVTRSQRELNGIVSCSAERVGDGVFKLTLEVTNETVLTGDARDRNQALLCSLLSAHMVLTVEGGQFISLLEPPEHLVEFASGCKNVGNFPVMLGEAGTHDMLLCSPILLDDYPQIAPESAGDFFDGTEMDEMLTLRVMTLTEEEKNEMRSADDRVRMLLQRTEETAREQLMRTHGTIRDLRPSGEK
jgi:hypothetical protein